MRPAQAFGVVTPVFALLLILVLTELWRAGAVRPQLAPAPGPVVSQIS